MADWFIATEGVKVVKDSSSLWPQIFTAAAAFGGVWYGQWRITQRENYAAAAKLASERLYISTELIFLLERYADGCARVATDQGIDNNFRQPEREPEVDYPKLYLADVAGDWRALELRHLYRIRELPLLQDEAHRAIKYACEMPSPPLHEFFFRERQYQFARIGLKAVIMAERLRRASGNASGW